MAVIGGSYIWRQNRTLPIYRSLCDDATQAHKYALTHQYNHTQTDIYRWTHTWPRFSSSTECPAHMRGGEGLTSPRRIVNPLPHSTSDHNFYSTHAPIVVVDTAAWCRWWVFFNENLVSLFVLVFADDNGNVKNIIYIYIFKLYVIWTRNVVPTTYAVYYHHKRARPFDHPDT